MPAHDPIERLAAADPLGEGERLTESDQPEADALLARILADDPEPVRRPRRRPRSWMFAVAATACALALALVAIDVLDEDTPGPSVVERAVAAVSDGNAIYHTVARMRLGNPDDRAPRPATQPFYLESWYGPNEAEHTKLYELDGDRRGKLRFEVAQRLFPNANGRLSGRGTSYDAESNTIMHPRFGRTPNGPVPVPTVDPSHDPGVGLRKLERHGRLHLAGTTRFAGKKVYRLVSRTVRGGGLGVDRIEYLVDASTYYPVFVRWVLSGGNASTGAEIRFLTYERLPFDAQGRQLLRMDPHPGAELKRSGRLESSGGSGGR